MTDRNEIPDEVAATAFWRLVDHLRHRKDAQNVDLMGLAGFCRNCLSEWLEESAAAAGQKLAREDARALVYGMPYAEWKANHQAPATPAQLERMEQSLKLNPRQG